MLLKIKSKIQRYSRLFLLILGLFAFVSTPVFAATFNSTCVQDIKLSISALFNPAQFIPIIPAECSGGGKIEPLSLQLVSVVAARGYALIASLVFYFFGVNLLFAGIRYSYAALNPSEATKALGMIQESGVSLALVLVSHLVISTIFTSIFQLPFSTAMGNFFS
jgi:hypothetical protein